MTLTSRIVVVTGRLFVADCRDAPIKLGKLDGELLMVGMRSVLKETKRQSLAQEHGRFGIAAPVDTRMDTMTVAHIVRQLVQFTVDGDLARIRTRVGHEREAITRGHHGIGPYVTAVEEEFQQGNASAPNRSVTSRIGRVIRGALGESLGKQIRPIFAEALRHRLRVQNIAVQPSVDPVLVAAQNLVQNPSACLGTMRQVNQPLLEPHSVKRTSSDFSLRGSVIRSAERAETILSL